MNDVHELDAGFDRTDPVVVRKAIRAGKITGETSRLGSNYTQGNLAILPADLAMDFLRYCQRNPKPCPLVGISETSVPMLPTLGRDINIRMDIPSYNVYRGGEFTDTVTDICKLWRDDFVSFIIGCSFSLSKRSSTRAFVSSIGNRT